MPFIEQLGMQAAQNAVGGAMGLVLGGIDRKAQLKQQQKLQNMQIAGQMEMGRFNQQQALEMWDKTNYYAQMQQLKKAGLNPGLIYGMGGGGGAIANATPGQVTAAQAAPNSPAAGMGMQMGSMQLALLDAQKKNIEADTLNKQSENPNIPKAGVKLDTEIESLKQGITSAKSQQALTEAETAIKNIQAHIAAETMNLEISKIQSATKIIRNDASISDATKESTIIRMNAEALGAILENAKTKAATRNINQDTQLKWQQVEETIGKIKFMIAEQNFMNKKIDIEREMNRLREQANDLNDPNLTPHIQSIIGGVVGGIIGGAGAKPNRPGEVTGFHKRN